MTRAFFILAGLCGCISVAVFTVQRRLIFPTHHLPPVPSHARLPVNAEQIWVEHGQVRVESWFLPGLGVSVVKPGPLVIFFHGNAEVIDELPQQFTRYTDMGISVALMEYRGYGRSNGSPSQKALSEDAAELYRRLIKRPDVRSERVFFHGRSLGGGVACALAARHRPVALILESTFTSLRAMASRLWIPGFLVRDPFDNADVLQSFDAPSLILHGREDEIIPFAHGEVLANLNPQARLVAFDAGHNDLAIQTRPYWTTITDFINKNVAQ
jgi:pimeloyl-ACP methyl ester carboxylesterase